MTPGVITISHMQRICSNMICFLFCFFLFHFGFKGKAELAKRVNNDPRGRYEWWWGNLRAAMFTAYSALQAPLAFLHQHRPPLISHSEKRN